jgi:glycosyltransferase involved in cell wall biosynthesis
MNKKALHIVSFDYPFPPNYGGIIEVFYKIKPLHDLGVEIHFHCFVDEIPANFEIVKSITEQVYFYKNKNNPFFIFSKLPFSVARRNHLELVKNIEKTVAPILFEGLKPSFIVTKGFFKDRRKILRLHNVEHNYFNGISKSETNFFKKLLFKIEAIKFKNYEKTISNFDQIIALAKKETDYIKKMFPEIKTSYIPVFHGNERVKQLEGFGDYAIYHGDLRMSDNKKVVRFLIEIFKKIDYKLVIAAIDNAEFVKKQSKGHENISFIKIENFTHLQSILAKAHINILLSYQQSGTKLKLVNSLYNSRFCLINQNICDDEKLTDLCEFVVSEKEIISKIEVLKSTAFTDFNPRKSVLESYMNDSTNAQLLSNAIFENELQ